MQNRIPDGHGVGSDGQPAESRPRKGLWQVGAGRWVAVGEDLFGDVGTPPTAIAIDVDQDELVTLAVGVEVQAMNNSLCGADRDIVLTGAAAEDNTDCGSAG